MQNQTNKSTTKYYILGIVTGILAAVAITLGIAGIVRFIHVLVPLSQGNAMAGSHITDGNVEKKLALLEDTIRNISGRMSRRNNWRTDFTEGCFVRWRTRTASIIQMMSWLRYSSRQKAYIMESAPIFRMEIPGMCRSAA